MPRRLTMTRTEPSTEHTCAHDIVTFPTRENDQQRRFDLGQLGLCEDIKAVLRYGIVHHPTPIAHQTQEQYWYSITTFARFAEEHGLRSAKGLNTELIEKYREWLKTQTNRRTGRPWGRVNEGKKLITLKSLVQTTKSGKPELLSEPDHLPATLLPRRHARPEQAKATSDR